ncbi:putative Ubiquitin carboxyl-terminal hydrolase 8 [Hypsibius exemplaris]|uniref:ubiquitinyl hydrolase 1 n=1 Tax=Hypsibius exemplaris TaxID=2072580 RepID=A0A9X6RKG0_HYPEX|nr:putative Ubiquitin carboxyl-terminal hydrolase 8 [Hypsibius exemplaris]
MSFQICNPLPLRSACMEDLEKEANVDIKLPGGRLQKRNAIRRLAKTFRTVDENLAKAFRGQDEEMAFIMAMRYFTVFTTIYQNQEYLEDDKKWLENLFVGPEEVIMRLETLKSSLVRRFYLKSHGVAPPPTPIANGLTPTVLASNDKENRNGRTSPRPDLRYEYNSSQADAEVVHKRITVDFTQPPEVETELTAGDLNVMLKKKDDSFLIIDIRDSGQYAASHVLSQNIINIPGERLSQDVVSIGMIEASLDPSFVPLWRVRQTFERIIIVDSEGTDTGIVGSLIEALTEYSAEPVKNLPLLLKGGFYGLITRFPQCTSDPHHGAPRVRTSRLQISEIKFPAAFSISIFSDLPDPVSPEPPRKSPSTTAMESGTDPDLDAESSSRLASKPSPSAETAVELTTPVVPPVTFRSGTTVPKLPLQPQFVSTLPTPSVNRANKPSSAVSSISTAGGVSVVTISKSENSFDSVVNNPGVVTKRGSVEIRRAESSDEETKKPAAATKFIPDIPRAMKPSASTGPPEKPPTAPVSPSPVNRPPLDPVPPKTAIGSSTTISNAGKDFRAFITKSPTPVPGMGGAKQPNGIPASSHPANIRNVDSSPKVVNVPIVVEKRIAPVEPPAPEVKRTLKPIENLPSQRRTVATLPEPPRPQTLEPSEFWPMNERHFGYTGLKNMGNWCYMNSVLQCLAHTRPFREFYKTGNYKLSVNAYNTNGAPGKLSVYMAELMNALWSGKFRYFTPRFLKNCLAEQSALFRGDCQQDAQEALVIILDLLHVDTNQGELLAANVETRAYFKRAFESAQNHEPAKLAAATLKYHKQKTSSVIDSHLTFLKETVTSCDNCKYPSHTFLCDQMISLSLDSRKNSRMDLSTLLAKQMRTSDGGEITWTCEKCKSHCTAHQEHWFNTLPRILVVQLKRFRSLTEKDDRPVHYPHELSLKPFCVTESRGSEYRLYAVLHHFGGLSSGHYIADVLHCDSTSGLDWLRCDDERVTEISKDDVISSSAYVLFYEQKQFRQF